MRKNKKLNIWGLVARLILRNRFLILLGILLLTGYWSTQWKNMQFTFTEANLLPDNHPENILYQSFIQTFGEEGNVIVIAVQDSSFYTPSQRLAWKALNEKIEGYQEINFVLSTENIQELVKDNTNKSFVLKEVSEELPPEGKFPEKFKEKLYLELPFFENLLFEKKSNTIRSIIYMDPEIVNTAQRKDFIFDFFIPLIKNYEETYDSDIRVSGMPYIRTLNAQNIVDEIGLFVLGAALITTLIFFLFFWLSIWFFNR